MKNVAVFGAGGAIGGAFIQQLLLNEDIEYIFSFSRNKIDFANSKVQEFQINYDDEEDLAKVASSIKEKTYLDTIIVAIGMLHDNETKPEKSLKDISVQNLQKVFLVNTIYPIIIAKHFIGLFKKDNKNIIAFLSARVGSISDNHLGGWYAYRASKVALNMMIKNISLEIKRTTTKSVVIGLHPGTVDSNLSKPYQNNIKHEVFNPTYSVQNMLKVMDTITMQDSGKIFAWDGSEILP